MNRVALLALLLLPSLALAQAAPEYELPLDHLKLSWSATTGLVVACDGRTVLAGAASPVVAHPPGWAWSYSAKENLTAALEKKGQQQVLTITCQDPKLPWVATVTAGPGDCYTLAYSFKQLAWDEAMQYEVSAAMPTPNWFVGSQYSATVNGKTVTGTIPQQFADANPFGEATAAEFSALFGKVSFKSTLPLTLYDYKQRDHLWLGRDGDMPKGATQQWSVDFAYTPSPFAVAGVELSAIQLDDRPLGEKLPVQLSLRRTAQGPAQVTARLATEGQAAVKDEKTVTLTETAAPVKLSVPLPGPGRHLAYFEILAGDKSLLRSPTLAIQVPRLIGIRPARLPFATGEKASLLVQVTPEAGDGLTVEVTGPGGAVAGGAVVAGKLNELPLAAGLPQGRTALTAVLKRGEERLGSARCELLIAAPVANGVVIDNRSRTLLVNGLPFCPQACYADIRSVNQVIETEPVFGFNTVAPYLSADIAKRRTDRAELLKMLDRCAQVGLHVQLCIHAASKPPHTDEKWAWLKEEVEAVRDHPALLTYYLADEPELGWAKPEDCELAYRKIKELDPWHPVTMVFCQSGMATRYAAGMDVCMTDPYPIPNSPVTDVAMFCDRINRDLAEALPLWVVPQAFGGGEWWKREPSRQEMRVMTYLSLIHGARGIQYFIRRPPAVNPNSPDLWSECRRLMFELGQLTPELCSPEPQPQVTTATPGVQVMAVQRAGEITVLVANVRNEPAPLELALPAGEAVAEVVFENRSVPVKGGTLVDLIDAMSTRVYRVRVQPAAPEKLSLDPGNLINNPSWEEAHNVGTPDGCYVNYGADQGASWYVDPRVAAHGRNSLRLNTPVEGQGLSVNPYPIKLTGGKKYVLSIWAKGSRAGQKFVFSLDQASGEAATHALSTQWQEFRVPFTASADVKARISPRLSLLSSGEAWFDMLQCVPAE